MWNIHDLSAFSGRQPKFTRSWLARLKKQRREGRKKQVGFKSDVKGGGFSDEGSLSPSRSPVRKMGTTGGAGVASDDQDRDSAESGSSSEGEGKGITLKGASQYLAYQPKDKKADKTKNVNEERYFKNILRLEPQIEKGNHLKHLKNKLFNEFKHKYKNSNNAFLND